MCSFIRNSLNSSLKIYRSKLIFRITRHVHMILKFCSGLHAKSNKPFMTSFLFFFFYFPHSAYIHFLFVIIMMYKYFVKFNLQLFITSTKIWKNGVVWYNMHDNIQSLHKVIFNVYWLLSNILIIETDIFKNILYNNEIFHTLMKFFQDIV